GVGDLARGVGAAAGLAGMAEDHLVDEVGAAGSQAGPRQGGGGGGGAEIGSRQRRQDAAEPADLGGGRGPPADSAARTPPNLPIGVRTGAANTMSPGDGGETRAERLPDTRSGL